MSLAEDERFMRRAIALSRQAGLIDCTGGPFGCVITRNGEIIAEGFNQVLTERDPTWHAEIAAIRQACQHLQTVDLSGCTLYTSAEPCPMCAAAVYWAKLDRLVFATRCSDTAAYAEFDDSTIYAEIQKPARDRTIPHQELLRSEAQIVWQDYQQQRDRTPN
ncbi:nucleoside deaminase [Synechococcus elongatus]|uniref:Cytosine/adenosine deaminases-like n=1 Tax=Synechococcus elongatus (strain ATCC 33912 / PCC 7942 / FACHB-805) TaxID=1140 RepID=Q31S17_SYNE7|nr:nucleoside deaminase [Synechococcus elongatus]ABB56152.1 Cytosine/adenosine deaminases-like [Synechococcus elongatus PCC 7942 = FACHB-805]AJD56793.1 dCMP deaminase [Synechococcus elongatus UTEX 2973]MBD2587985.1 nucleoside deaminase [Synechococcus elongatus FACHB-242]MBD2689053.1 nucleoside deaminase [Synechococcus elongatus FACHB-1061]MBD2707307.1 nucleoside deaminase [Synechococcus elongatus PCC 7942 = FACHB-805]